MGSAGGSLDLWGWGRGQRVSGGVMDSGRTRHLTRAVGWPCRSLPV